jgi:anti-sigma B factor antagonist
MIKTETRDRIEIISFLVNTINALITDEIKDSIFSVIDNTNSKIIIDLKGVEYIDSSGFGCFLSIMREARNNYGVLKFANPEPKVKELFQTLQLNTVFQIYDDVDSCIRSFNQYG